MENPAVRLLIVLLSLSRCDGKVSPREDEIISAANPLILNEQADLVYLLPETSCINGLPKFARRVSRLYQIAFVYNESAFLNNNVTFSRGFSVTTVLVQKPLEPSTCAGIFNRKSQNTSLLTWTFSSRDYITQIPGNLKLMDQLYYLHNSSTLMEMYKIKDFLVEQEVTGESVLSRRMNLRQRTIQAAHVRLPGFTSKSGRDILAFHNWKQEELTYQKMAFMQDFLNLTVRFHNVTFWVQSSQPGGIGMVDAIRMDQVDLALSNTGLWGSLEFRFLFITRIYSEVYVYYYPPPPSHHGLERVVEPNVWLFYGFIAGTLFLISPIFFSNWDFSDSFSWTVSFLTIRGVTEPQSHFPISARCFFFTSFAFGLLFSVALSSMLISILSVKLEISGMEELKRLGYSFGVWKDSVLANAFEWKRIPDKSPLSVAAKSKFRSFLKEEEGALEVISNPKFAYISGQLLYISYADYMAKIGGCRRMKLLTVQGEKRWGSAFVLADSPFTDHFNYARLRMSEAGIASLHLRKIKRNSDAVKQACLDQNKTPTNYPISMEELKGVLYIYSAGVLVTIPIFIVEYFRGKHGKVKSK